MKTSFIETLTALMRNHEDIITITPDMGYSVFENIHKEFPNRFYNTGVTEQSTVGLATGLSLSGYTVFVYAQAIFLTLRAFEQVRLDVAYHQSNVKLIGSAAGFWLNQLGVSHFALEDIGAMRLLPNITILSPGDPQEAAWATEIAYNTPGPVYLRLGKPEQINIHTKKVSASIGDILPIVPGSDTAILATGGLLPAAIDVAAELNEKHISVAVYSVPTIKPINTNQLLSIIRKYSHVFTLEEHSIIGGLGSAVAECFMDNHVQTTALHRLGTPDQFINYTGSREYLLAQSGLSPEKIAASITHCISKKA